MGPGIPFLLGSSGFGAAGVVAGAERFAVVDASGPGSTEEVGAGGVGEDDGDDEDFIFVFTPSGLLVEDVPGQRLREADDNFRVTIILRLFDRLAVEGDVVSEDGIAVARSESGSKDGRF